MYKLLIVDDEPLVCVGVQSMLDWAALGIEVVGTARNGAMALKMVAEYHPDIVISDIKMPVKDGLALARECGERYGRLPIFIMLTSHEGFEYVRQALKAQVVDYLVKLELNAETLAKAVDKALVAVRRCKAPSQNDEALATSQMQAQREKFFIRLYNNLFNSEEMYEAQKRDLAIDFSATSYAVAGCRLRTANQGRAGEKDPIPLYASAMDLAREILSKYMPCHVVPLDIWHFTVVFSWAGGGTHRQQKAVREALLQTAASLRSYLGLSLHAAVGGAVANPRDLGISYRQAQHYLHGIIDSDPVVFAGGSVEQDGRHTQSLQQLRGSIRRAFEEMDTAALNEALTHMAEQYDSHPDELLQAMDTTCNILYMAISLLPQGEALVKEIFENWPEGYRSLYRLRDAASIAQWVRQLRDGCNEKLFARQQSYKAQMVVDVKTYIRKNLGKRLSLQEVAAVFNFNPNYLSQLFSKYAGERFVEYITKTRIEAAKELLVEGELRIYEIAERLGFENSFYFSKVFKKAEGVSPREYLNRLEAPQRKPGGVQPYSAEQNDE